MQRRSTIVLCAWATVTAAAMLGGAPASAQGGWPDKPVKLIVPFPAGGTSDQLGRLAAEELGKAFRQPFVVENRPGANGSVGSAAAARMAPDGYTLLLSGVGSHGINPGLYGKVLTYDTNNDFVHITQMTAGPNVLVVHPSFAVRDFKEFIGYLRTRPGQFSYASSGTGSSGHLAMELLKHTADVQLSHVPYRGGAPALADVLGNQVPMMFLNQDVVLEHVRAGRLRALAVTSPKRNPLYPDVPAIAESYPGFAAVSWAGLSAPRGTPPAIVDAVQAALAKALASPAVKSRLEGSGFVIVASKPADYQAYVQAEAARWAQLIARTGIKPE